MNAGEIGALLLVSLSVLELLLLVSLQGSPQDSTVPLPKGEREKSLLLFQNINEILKPRQIS